MRRFDATFVTQVILPTLLVASFGIFMTAVTHRLTTADDGTAAREATSRVADRLTGAFTPSLALLHGIHAFWIGSEEVTESEFHAAAGEVYGFLPEVTAIEWVDADDVIRYVFPKDENAAAVGLDLKAYPNRAPHIRKARETGETVMAEPVFLVQGYPGAIVYDPVFRDGAYLGSVMVVLRLDDILSQIRNSLVSRDYDIVLRTDDVLLRPDVDAIFRDGRRVTSPDGSSANDSRAPKWRDDIWPGTAVVADRLWLTIATPKHRGSPAAAMIGIISLGMTALCGIFFLALRSARRKLERALARERDFTSLVSHQLRAPLTELNWMTDVLAEPEADEATRASTLDDMRTIVRQGVRTVNMLLNISRIERGVLQVKREDVPVATIVDDALASLREQSRAKGITFNIDVAAEHSVHVDQTHAVEALRNVVDNAVKYGPAKRPVTVSSRADAESVTIDVTDHGPGIPDAVAATLFEKATASQKKTSTDGAGLGLYLTKMLVELMGGDVTMRTSPGNTVFSLRFPHSAGEK